MNRGLIDRDSFLRLEPPAQETLLRQTLLLYLTALELANLNPDEWESAAFAAAVDHLAAKAPLQAYHEIERMLLPSHQRPRPRKSGEVTAILRVEAGTAGLPSSPRPSQVSSPGQKLDRNGMRRRLLQLSAIRLPKDGAAQDHASAARENAARLRGRRKLPQPLGADNTGD